MYRWTAVRSSTKSIVRHAQADKITFNGYVKQLSLSYNNGTQTQLPQFSVQHQWILNGYYHSGIKLRSCAQTGRHKLRMMDFGVLCCVYLLQKNSVNSF